MCCIWRKCRREIKKANSIHITSPHSLSVNPRQCKREELPSLGQVKQGSVDLSTTEQGWAQSDSVMDTAEWKAIDFLLIPCHRLLQLGLFFHPTDIWLKILRALGKWFPETKIILFLSTTKRYPFQTSKCARWAIFHMPKNLISLNWLWQNS